MAAWDAEEFTLTGSTEWGEENEKDLKTNAVVCINVDDAARGSRFSPSASPLLFTAIRDAARDLPDPGAPGKSLADTWRERAGFIGVGSYATAAAGAEDLPVAILGSGSDYTVFFNHLGIASADLVFDGPYGVYHSVYDSYRWMATEGDPGFRYTAAMATYAGLLALRFANADVSPLRRGCATAARSPGTPTTSQRPRRGRPSPRNCATSLHRPGPGARAAGAAQKTLAARVRSAASASSRLRDGNAWLLSLERAVLDPAGAAGPAVVPPPVYAPLPSYKAETLPAIREALVEGRSEFADLQIHASPNGCARRSRRRGARGPSPSPSRGRPPGRTSESGAAYRAPSRGIERMNMQRQTLLAAVLALVGASPARAETFVGWITDAECGPYHAPMIAKGGMGRDDRECTLKCVAKGAPYGFVD